MAVEKIPTAEELEIDSRPRRSRGATGMGGGTSSKFSVNTSQACHVSVRVAKRT